jgi:hypothetical protein
MRTWRRLVAWWHGGAPAARRKSLFPSPRERFMTAIGAPFAKWLLAATLGIAIHYILGWLGMS